MMYFRYKIRNLIGLSLAMFVMLGSSVAYGQAVPDGQIKSEGISSYIFSPMAITSLLVLALIVQIVYWHYSKNTNRKQHVASGPEPVHAAKKRYDKGSMSKLLKASASAKGNQRSLEEAIRLSQLTQPVLPERAEHIDSERHDAPEMAELEVSDADDATDDASEMVQEVNLQQGVDADDNVEVSENEDSTSDKP